MIKEGLFEQKTFEMRRCQLREGLEGRAFLKGLHRRDSSGARWEIGEAWFLPVLRNAQGTHEFLFVCLFVLLKSFEQVWCDQNNDIEEFQAGG